MKEVCERTGLTDRAIRLYIDSSLLNPKEEKNYSGRKSIYFSEDDVSVLETIATLRKADFSISDIKEMQVSPERISSIIDLHKQKLAADIENKKQILQSLTKINGEDIMDYSEIADLLRQSASKNNLPKEDYMMNFKDFQQTVKNRIFAVIAFALLLIGVAAITPCFIKAAFADVEIAQGGGYNLTYSYTWDRLADSLPMLGSLLGLTVSVILLFSYIITGKNILMISGNLLCIVSVIVLLLLPTEVKENLFRFEHLSYRYSFMWHIFYYNSASFDVFIKSLKFICPFAAIILTGIGIFKEKNK